jgi:hypothetical protein
MSEPKITPDYITVLAYKSSETDKALGLVMPSQRTIMIGNYGISRISEELTETLLTAGEAAQTYGEFKEKTDAMGEIIDNLGDADPDEETALQLARLNLEAEDLLKKLRGFN